MLSNFTFTYAVLARTGLSPVSSLSNAMLAPVTDLMSFIASLHMTATSMEGLDSSPLTNLVYLPRVSTLTLLSPQLRRWSTKYLWVYLGTCHVSLTQVDQALKYWVAMLLPRSQSMLP